MKLFVIVLCLLSERFLIHAISYQRFSWFDKYYSYIKNLCDTKQYVTQSPYFLLVVVGPLALVVLALYLILHPVLFGLLGLLANIAIFYYCIGPQNPFYPITETDADAGFSDPSGLFLAKVNRQLFCTIFWYALAGPVAVLVYRLITLSESMSETKQTATQLSNILEWIPARLTVLLYLLVGNFQSGLKHLMPFLLAKPELNNHMLYECGLFSIRNTEEEPVSMPIAETLVEHATIVLLVLIALVTLAGRFSHFA